MQLKLIPPAPAPVGPNANPAMHLPTVLFTLSYPPPPSYLPLPAAYGGLVKVVVEEGLLDGERRRSLGLTNELLGSDPFAAHSRGENPFGNLGNAGESELGTGSLTPHSLDKSTWLAAVLSEVVFDLSGASTAEHNQEAEGEVIHVRCRYCDGREVEWMWDVGQAQQDVDGEGEGCYAALRRVLSDVSASAAAGERERRVREGRWRSVENQYAQSVEGSDSGHSREGSDDGHIMGRDAGASIPGTVEVRRGKEKEGKKHKKQRSLLMSLVAFASLITPRSDKRASDNSTSQVSAPEQGHIVHPQVRPPTPHTQDHEDVISSSDLRRRARATLVDVFRRYVLTKLKTAVRHPSSVPLTPTRGVSAHTSAACSPDSTMSVRSNIGVYHSVRGSDPSGFSPYESTDDLPLGLALACGGLDASHGYERGYGSANEGGYLAWVVRSLLWRLEGELMRIRALTAPTLYKTGRSPTLVDEPVPPFFDDYSDGEFEDVDLGSARRDIEDDVDGETTSTSTETSDGSSVHTPVEGSCYEDTAQVCAPDSDETGQSYFPALSEAPRTPTKISRPMHMRQHSHSPTSLPRTPSPATRMSTSPPPSPHALHTALRALTAEKARLLSVLTRIAAHTAAQAADEAHVANVLEIKSRRRAWSNRQFMGRAEARFVGLATPERRSSLGRACVCATDVALEADRKRELVVTTAENNILRLFPVCEEEEDADMAFVMEGSSKEEEDVKMLRDAEDGLLRRTSRMDGASPPRRRRTMSIGPILPAPVTMGAGSGCGGASSYPGAYPRLSCAAAYTLHEPFNPQTKVDLFDALGDDDDDEDERWGTA